jgi:predicted nucleotidyltransferase
LPALGKVRFCSILYGMNEGRRENIHESYRTPDPDLPAVESFSSPEEARKFWPEHVANNPEFIAQLEFRKKLNEHLDAIAAKLPRPDITLQEAIAQNYVSTNEVAGLYESLAELMADPDYRRILLYTPFEFLPDAEWRPEGDLGQSAENFKSAYMKAWSELLNTHDVRANFVDGDILEDELRTEDFPRVVKAAHLIPQLVAKGMMQPTDVFRMMEENEDEVLRQSIAETLPVMADLGLLDKQELSFMEASEDPLIRDAYASISSAKEESEDRQTESMPEEITLSTVQSRLGAELAQTETDNASSPTTPRRTEWLKQEKTRQVIESTADQISLAVVKGKLSDESFAEFLGEEADTASQQVLIVGVDNALESMAKTDQTKAKELYEKYEEGLINLWYNKPETRAALSKAFCRLHGLGIVSDGRLSELGITIPALAGPFSENMKAMRGEINDVKNIIDSIESDPELSQLIYPVAMVFGSRLKGYGNENSDTDIGVFVKPGTSPSEGARLRNLLNKAFEQDTTKREIKEFWLEETNGELAVRDLEGGPEIGSGTWTYVLFGAAWEGDQATIKELREKLLTPYMHDDREKIIHEREARKIYLEELERDTLQYRLMHKGYEKFHPSFGGIRTPHADKIDGKSAFWDSGYRMTATKLFANRVFLPKISKPTA